MSKFSIYYLNYSLKICDIMYSELFDFQKRLDKVFSNMESESLLIVDANPPKSRTGDTDYVYRPKSYLLYLIGFEEPKSHIVLTKDKNDKCETLLFVQERDPEKETWTGKIIGPENAKKLFKVTDTFKINEFPEWLQKNALKFQKLYFNFGYGSALDEIFIALFRDVIRSKTPEGPGVTVIEKYTTIIDKLRLFKDKKEIEVMQKACNISAQAHINAMKIIKPSIKEYEIENVVNSYFRAEGGEGPAYSSICATGNNATILHYISNKDECKDGELFLIDAATEYKYYASDISRTYPVNGKFTDIQKKVYNIVLKAEKKAIEACTIGNTYFKIHELTLRILTEGLVELGILEGDIDKLLEEKKYMPYYMHGTGHWVGLETHDVGGKREMKNKEFIEIVFQPGMITTIEPGLYFSNTIEGLPEQFKGIGVRIEDDILITEQGPVILTDKVPKEISDIEDLMARK